MQNCTKSYQTTPNNTNHYPYFVISEKNLLNISKLLCPMFHVLCLMSNVKSSMSANLRS